MKLASSLAIACMIALPASAGAQQSTEIRDRCARGAEHAKRGDATRAMLYLEGCEDPDLAKIARALKKKLRETEYAELSVVSDPAGVAFEIDSVPGEKLVTPATVFLKAGVHTIAYQVGEQTFTKVAETKAYSRSATILDAVVAKAPAHQRTVPSRSTRTMR